MFKRRSFRHESLTDRLTSFAKGVREKASLLPPGMKQEDLLRKARQADTAFHMDEWLSLPGLQPPK
jgi:hypothetical protein